MADKDALIAQARAERRRALISIPSLAVGPIVEQLDRLTMAKLLRKKIEGERNLRDAAIRVKTEEVEREKADQEKKQRAVSMALAGQLTPEQALASGVPEAVKAALGVQAQRTVGALPDLASVQEFEAQNPMEAEARSRRITELVDAGEMEKKRETEKQRQDISKSITAASSLEELDRIDTGGDSPLGTSLNRKRKVLSEEQDRRLGEALSTYKGDVEGLGKFFEEKGVKPTPGDVSRAEDIVFKRKAYERVTSDMAEAEEKKKAGKTQDASALYQKSANALNAQIDDIEKKAIKVNFLSGERSFDESLLSASDKTLLIRLKGDRLKAIDALTSLSTADPLMGMGPEEKRALLKRLVEEGEGK